MKTQPFWSWFLANEKILRNIHSLSEKGREELLYWFSKHLDYYSPKIGYRFIIPHLSQEPPTLSFSTSGDPELRILIVQLLETAPKLPHWIITASITSLADQDPNYFEKEYCLNSLCCKPSQIKFWTLLIDPETDQFILAIHLHISTNNIDPDLVYETVVAILIDTLGDEKYNHHIEDIIIHNQLPVDEEILELKELKLYLEGYNHRKNNEHPNLLELVPQQRKKTTLHTHPSRN